MKLLTQTLYKFSELSPAAQARALKAAIQSRYEDPDNFWAEHPLEEAAEQGRLLGFTFDERPRKSLSGKPLPGEPKIYWSGFSSQGDGACFEGSWSARDCLAGAAKVAEGWGCKTEKRGPEVGPKKHASDCPTCELRAIAAALLKEVSAFPSASFLVKHRGHYRHENCTEFVFDEDSPEYVCEQLEELAKDFMRWIYRSLEAAYDYETSEENVLEQLRDLDEEIYDEDGDQI